jgi:hypothetical protein
MQIYEDQVHGFALRSDWSSDKDKKAMDDAEKQGIAWFQVSLTPLINAFCMEFRKLPIFAPHLVLFHCLS